jgi:GT2 family glycosyltransferase
MSLARGEYILVLDDDTELAPDCIDRLLDFMTSRPDVAMVAPRTFNSDGSIQESARNFPGVLSGLFGRQSVLTRVFPQNRFSQKYLARDFLHQREPFEVEQIGAACMFFRRKVLAAIGPWDERYVGYWVDTDWCRSARARQLPIYCIPDAHLTHHEGNARSKRRSIHRSWIFHRGVYQYYTKWHCRGAWDPRSILAGFILAARASTQIIVDATLKRGSAPGYKQIEIESVPGDSRNIDS